MKLKKITFAFVVVALSCALFAGNAFAAWAACTPKAIGPYGSDVRLQVTECNVDPSSGLGWIQLSSTGTDQMMATILTAMSLQKPIAVQFDGSKGGSGYNIATAIIFTN